MPSIRNRLEELETINNVRVSFSALTSGVPQACAASPGVEMHMPIHARTHECIRMRILLYKSTCMHTYIYISNSLRHPATVPSVKNLANHVPGDTQKLQRLTGDQFSSVRYYI